MNTGVNQSVGVLFYAADTARHLFLLRADRSEASWSLPGGKVEVGETLRSAIERECREETGFWSSDIRLLPLEQYTNDTGKFVYHTFYSILPHEFMPQLNDEHTGYAWVKNGQYPRPLHRGLFNTLNYSVIQEKIAIIHQAVAA